MMESRDCPDCQTELDADETTCPRCGCADARTANIPPAIVRSMPASLGRVAHSPSTARWAIVRMLAVAVLGWLGYQAYLAWQAHAEHVVGLLLPCWNTAVAVGMVIVVRGAFARREWAWRWLVGVAALNAIGNLHIAVQPGGGSYLAGVAIQAIAAIYLWKSRAEFAPTDLAPTTVKLGKLLGVLALAGSIAVGVVVAVDPGTEAGRVAFAAEIEGQYHAAGATEVTARARGRDLVIVSPTDSDDQIDGAATQLRIQLSKTQRPKAWALGYERIVITNGAFERILKAP